jgi:sugar phosphate isomerase/epimerase
VTLSGCPGDSDQAKYPNWPVSPWPNDFQEILKYQWEDVLIPYWKEVGKIAIDNNVKIALEMHGGFSVHTPSTVVRLRTETKCESIGANVDPSHLWWQGIDPVQAIRYLGKEKCIFFFHAKDTIIEPCNTAIYGVTDMQPYSNLLTRGWQFRTVGYGHGIKEWADIISTLRMVGYDGVVSIEHEDACMSVEEGLEKAISNLNQVIMTQPASMPTMFAK